MTDINLDALHAEMTGLNAKIKELNEQAAKTSQEVFKTTLAKFFEAVPEIQIIFWHQYTPYFNDGDACEFSVGDVNFYAGEDDKENDDDGGYDSYNPFKAPGDWTYEQAKDPSSRWYETSKAEVERYEAFVAATGAERVEQVQRAIADVKKLFLEISDEYFLMMFGDHVEVTATKSGFQVDEFDHE